MASSGSFNTSGYSGRYLTFSWSVASQSIANNQTTINWNLKGAGGPTNTWYKSGNFKVVINGSTVYSSATRINLYNGTTVASGSFVINHDASGNGTVSASAEAGIYTVAVNCSGSGSWALPQIPRQATLTNAPNFNDTQNPTITYSNPAGNNVTTLRAYIQNSAGTVTYVQYKSLSKTGTSYTFNLTDAERNTLRQATPNSNTMEVRFVIDTVIGGNTFSSAMTKTLTIVNANPTISSIAYQDTNSTTTGITGNNQVIIQNNSTLQFIFSTLTALKYATLKSVAVTLNGVTKSASLSGSSSSSATINFGAVNIASNTNASIVITDSRNNKTSYSKAITIESWSLPSAIITCQRENNYYDETNINVNADYSSLDGNNTISITYQYKKTTDSTYSSAEDLEDDVTTTFSIDNEYAWNIKVVVSDLLGSTTYNLFIDKGIPIVYFDRLNNSTGFNCFPKNQKSVEINGSTIFDLIYPVGSIYISVNNTNPSTIFGGTWEQITDKFLVASGSTYTGGSTGGSSTHVHKTPLGFDGTSLYGYAGSDGNPAYGSTVLNTKRISTPITSGTGALRIGSTDSASNLPPYLAVYVWKRTA